MELWSTQWELDDLKNKIKFHHLAHLSMWAKRFGPTIVGSTETNKAANKRIRRHLSLANRQACSRDLAGKLATAQGIQFLAQEGIWRVNKDAVTMTRPGSALRELCRVPEVRDLVGLPTPGSPAKADVLVPIRINNVVQNIRGHLIKQRYGLDCVGATEYDLRTRLRWQKGQAPYRNASPDTIRSTINELLRGSKNPVLRNIDVAAVRKLKSGDLDEQSEYFLFSRFRLVDAQLGLGKVSSFVSTGETVLL
jgi:hypothetical protein